MNRRTRLLSLGAILLLLAAAFGVQAYTADTSARTSRTDTGAYPGNTLISVQDYKFDGCLVEVTPNGNVAWEYDPPNSRVFDAEQLENGNILVAVTTKLAPKNCPAEQLEVNSDQCIKSRVLELDYETKSVVWKYTWYDEYITHHEVHDVDRLENGETAIIDMGNDRAFTVDRKGEITWEWHAENHLENGTTFYQRYGGDPNPGGEKDWTHMNDIDRLENGNFQISVRNFDVVIEVNPKTNKIVDVIGEPGNHSFLYEQHNPQRLEEWGTVLIADSENHRIVEYDVASGERVWEYGGDDILLWPRDADRLPNGNTLITDSLHNRVLEIDENGDIVWEYSGVDLPYAADRLSVPEEGGETVPGWQLENRTANAGSVVGTVRQIEGWASYVFPTWVKLPELLTLVAGALVLLAMVVDLSIYGLSALKRYRD
ncbi:aryl-sulfate sulfotransferase [Haladaptatus salinisoli]|uniref:aryl-sulfate sulfotransferase n=1 Tax=Haladaptatus salinisoli TaxID=2884876 RepID=UPI001D09CA7E|nr:aryl-sulfate sulfotransferase [Haladaptatus salinisoli]